MTPPARAAVKEKRGARVKNGTSGKIQLQDEEDERRLDKRTGGKGSSTQGWRTLAREKRRRVGG